LQLYDPVLVASPETAAVGLGQSGPVDLAAEDDGLKILDPDRASSLASVARRR
jgi:hypothetical protein